jgi:sulfur-oxidizing protein SoxB
MEFMTGSASAYALTYNDFSALAKGYGRVGGLDRVATVINQIRAERPDALLLDGGDTWHGSYTCHKTAGQDMVNVMNASAPRCDDLPLGVHPGQRAGQ